MPLDKNRLRAGMPAPGKRTSGRGGSPEKKCSHLRGGDRGYRAINTWPAGRLGGLAGQAVVPP